MMCSKSTAPPHPNLSVARLCGTPKTRKTYLFTGLSPNGKYQVFNNNLDTLEKAVKERVFYVKTESGFTHPPRPSTGYFALELEEFRSLVKRRVTYSTPLTHIEFQNLFQGRIRTRHQQATELNLQYGFHDNLARVQAFVKCEKYDFSKKIPVPRIIQPRDKRYIVETGRYIRPIEKKIYKIIDDIYGYKTVFKGANAEQRGTYARAAWESITDPVAVGLDASRFDQHVSNDALRWEHSVYQMFYPSDKFFKRLMGLQRSNKASGRVKDGKIKYHTKHNRMSGDSNTSLGNVLIMCAMVHRFMTKFNLQGRLLNDGDDCVLIINKHSLPILDQLKEYMLTLGFNIVMEKPVYTFEEIEFCQSHFCFAAGRWVAIRDPRSCVGKDVVALNPLDTPLTARRWLAAVGEGGLALSTGVPVMQAFYMCLHRSALGATPSKDPTLNGGFFHLSRGMRHKYEEPSDQARLSFYLAFGIPPTAQLAIESYYNSVIIDTTTPGIEYANLPFGVYNRGAMHAK